MMIIITFYERLLEFVLADIFLLQGAYFNYTQMNINRIPVACFNSALLSQLLEMVVID